MENHRIKITSIAATVIIYRKANWADIFLEKKDGGHPLAHARGKLCTIGGNWIGAEAKGDHSPWHTLRRELDEELSFIRPARDSNELAQLGLVVNGATFAPTPISEATVTENDKDTLRDLKSAIKTSLIPFRDFLHTIPRSVLDAADPNNKRDSFTALISYFVAGLDEEEWGELCTLQKKFGNLSSESLSVITSLDEMVERKTQAAFGHDQVLQRFWYLRGFANRAERLSLVPGIDSIDADHEPFTSYDKYLERYDVANKPV